MMLSQQELTKRRGDITNNRDKIKVSTSCVCIYCTKFFSPTDIVDWADHGNTALCPLCGIDAVIGATSKTVLSQAVIDFLHEQWFGRHTLH